MKKLFSVLLIVIILTLSACTELDGGKDIVDPIECDAGYIVINDVCVLYPGDTTNPQEPDRNLVDTNIPCVDGILLNDECVFLDDILSDNISITGEGSVVTYNDSGVELMNDYVADLTGSTGLAVMPRDVFEQNIDLSGSEAVEFINLAALNVVDESTENIIVTLTEQGFFEEVSFTDAGGNNVEILANPLALEVYGAFTVVIFEVNAPYYGEGYTPDFSQRVYDSLYAGGIYLIHNESGKLFATKEVTLREESYTYTENHSRNVYLTVTLNEPVMETLMEVVVDENGNMIVDEFGNITYEEVTVPVLDEDGNQLVYTEGPFLIETIEIPVTETYEVEVLVEQETLLLDVDGNQVLDEDGNPMSITEMVPVLDAEGKPTFTTEVVPLLDENGNQVIEYVEQVVLDAEGNPVYQTQFDVELYINDIREITHTTYYSTVADGPLTGLAQKFVDKIMQEYYDWSYWRPSYYSLSQNTFAVIGSDIYYMEQQATGDNNSELEQIVIKLSFDEIAGEILLENYMNTTKANFEDCEIVIDPSNTNLICNPWDGNIKIYAPFPGPGLKTIEDSDGLQSVTFPNGELYFFSQNYNHEYIEELGYSTTALYTISDDGELETHYIELGSSLSLCDPWENDTCIDYLNVNVEDSLGVPSEYDSGLYIQVNDGDARISNATLQLQSVGEFSSDRIACPEEQCYYQIQYEILDLEGNVIASTENGFWFDAADVLPNYGETYQIDPTTNITYEKEQSTVDKLCEEVGEGVGCSDDFYLVDYSFDDNGNWIWTSHIVANNEPLWNRLNINETNSVVYEYTKDVSGFECVYTTCEEYVKLVITDADGVVIKDDTSWMSFAEGEIVPLRVEYTITDDTVLTYTDDVCTTSTGCWQYYDDGAGYFYIQYDQGDQMYATIEFAETDKVAITEETLTNEICLDEDGCGWGYVNYIISEGDNELNNIEQYFNYDYGTQLPFRVLVDISDTTVETEKVYLDEVRLCEEASCFNWVYFYFVDDTYSYETDQSNYLGDYIGYERYNYTLGEEMISIIGVPEDTVPTVVDTLICKNEDGCLYNTNNYNVVDADGKEYQVTSEDWYNYHLPVNFAFGESLPNSEDFFVTYLIKDIEYYEQRIQIYDFMWSLQSTIILDDNLYLIERESWAQGEDNFILSFNAESGRYSVKYTNISAVIEITQFGESYIAINNDETAILNFSYNDIMSDGNYYYFDVVDLTDGLAINAVSDLIVDFDGSIYFSGVDNYIQDITGRINELGEVVIDTDYTPVEIVRVRPIN